jgi:hypothetical protein
MNRKNLLVSFLFAGLQSLALSAFAMEASTFPEQAPGDAARSVSFRRRLHRRLSRSSVRPPGRTELFPRYRFNRYPVLKIHATTATDTARKASVIARLTPTLTSAIP